MVESAIASGFGAGFLKPAPGTWGTLVGSLILFILSLYVSSSFVLPILTVIITGMGYWAINRLPEDWEHDDSRIVIDEVVGVMVSMWWIPLTVSNIILAFILFRLYDIVKPLGIRKFDELKSNWSVLVDDMLAGVYTNLTIRVIIIFLLWT